MNMPQDPDADSRSADVVKFGEMVLPDNLLESMEVPSEEPYKSDEEIYTDYGMLHFLCSKLEVTKEKISGSFGSNELPLGVTIDEKIEGLEYLESTVVKLRNQIVSRLSVTSVCSSCSSFLALVEKLKLSEKEREALAFMVNTVVGYDLQGAYRSELKGLKKICGMTTREIMDFLDDKRIHIIQELIDIDKGYGRSLLSMEFQLSEEILTFLFNFDDLPSEESEKMAGTVLYEILANAGKTENVLDEYSEDIEEAEEKIDLENREVIDKEKEDFDLHEFLAEECEVNKELVARHNEVRDKTIENFIQPYSDDLEYLTDYFQYILARAELKEVWEDDYRYNSPTEPKKIDKIRCAKSKIAKAKSKVSKRLEATKNTTSWYPRLERLAEKRKLHTFEKEIILALVGMVYDEAVFKGIAGSFSLHGRSSIDVATLLNFFADSLKSRLKKRKYFYRDSTLVSEGMVTLTGDFSSDILDYKISLDRKMQDYVAGLDTEISNLVEGGNLYFPKVKLDNVILAPAMKQEIIEIVKNSYQVEKLIKKYDSNSTYSYGQGTVLLFHGEPGTGKTMMANALANHLGKKILLINFPSLGELHGDKVLNFFLRLAMVNGALVFIDECDAAFQSRDLGSKKVNVLLSAIERFKGLIIMATNRPYDIDLGMINRIGFRFEFKVPDMHSREIIWKEHLLPDMNYADDINLGELAVRFDFSGRSIKNAVLAGISYGLSRKADPLQITMEDLERGASMQLQGHLGRAKLEKSIIPSQGLERIILPKNTKDALHDIVKFEKAKPILQSEWGFSEVASYGFGNGVLFYGPPGTGKTMAAEAIGYEVGCPIMVVNVAELQSKYVGETAKNIDAVFKEAKNNNCILVFDDAEGLFGERTAGNTSTDKYANMDSSILLEHIERFAGMVILTTNLVNIMDSAFKDRLKHKVEFKMPDAKMREKIWKNLIPAKAPISEDVDFNILAKKFEFSGRTIKNCVFKAAAKAAVRGEGERRLTMEDFSFVAGFELNVERGRRIGF